MTQMKEQIKTPEKELNKMETSRLLDKEFKTVVVRMLSELIEDLNSIKKGMEPGLLWLSGLSTWPANQRVTSSIPSQGTCWGCRPGPLAHERQPHIDVFIPDEKKLKEFIIAILMLHEMFKCL